VTLEHLDVSEVTAQVDLVVCNPPFFVAGSGPVSPNPWKAAARTESGATLDAFLIIALACLAPGGRACFVVPRARESELLSYNIHRRWAHVGAKRTLVELMPGASAAAEPSVLDEEDPRVRGWYAQVMG
jgi:tRNA1(Val) A37 N6-methylase TrmN6